MTIHVHPHNRDKNDHNHHDDNNNHNNQNATRKKGDAPLFARTCLSVRICKLLTKNFIWILPSFYLHHMNDFGKKMPEIPC